MKREEILEKMNAYKIMKGMSTDEIKKIITNSENKEEKGFYQIILECIPENVNGEEIHIATNVYEFIEGLNAEEVSELIVFAESLEESDFYAKTTEYLLQENQKRLIEEGVF